MAITLPRMRALNAVANTGSFAAAARQLGQSQPSVAQHVRDLESALNVRLFQRLDGQLVPTPLGAELCAVASRFEEAETSAREIVARRHALVDGRIAIGLGNAMPGMDVIALFHRRFPGVSFSVRSGSFEDITRAVVARDVDIGVLPNLPEDARFQRETLIRHKVVAIVTPDSPLAGAGRVGCRDLIRHKLIFRSRGSSTQRVIDRAFRQAGLDPSPLLVLDTRDAVYEAVASGLGVGFMWEHGTKRQDGIVRVPLAEAEGEHDEVVFAHRDDTSLLCRAFFDAAREYRMVVQGQRA